MARTPRKTTTRKPAGKAVATRQNTDMATMEAQLAAEVSGIQNQIGAVSGNKIKTKGKVFSFPDGTADPGPIQLVILDFISANKFYEGAYDADNIQPPVCFSISKEIKSMAPSKNSPDAQATGCQDCPMNQWGSDGRGKACKNSRLLAVMSPDATAEDDIMTLEVSPSAIKGFDAYVGTVARLFNKPPVAVVTEVSFDPTTDYAKLVFSHPEANANLAVHFAKRAEAQGMLEAEPDLSGASAPKKTTRRGRGRRAA